MSNATPKITLLPRTQDDEMCIEALYMRPMSMLEVSRAVGWTYDKTRYHLLKRGVVLRDKSTAKKLSSYVRSAETRAKMSAAKKKFFADGGVHPMTGRKMSEAQRLLFMQKRCRYTVDLSSYEGRDLDKLKFLMSYPRRDRAQLEAAGVSVEQFVAAFFDNPRFNRIYARWQRDPCKWTRPTLDHIVPRKRPGSSWALSNLQFMTWCENKDKGNRTQTEWLAFRRRYNIRNDLYEADPAAEEAVCDVQALSVAAPVPTDYVSSALSAVCEG